MKTKIKELNELQRAFCKWFYTKRTCLLVAPPGKGKTLSFMASFALFKKKMSFTKMVIITRTKQAGAIAKNNPFNFSIAQVRGKKDLHHFLSNTFPHDIYVISDGQVSKMLTDKNLREHRKHFSYLINTTDIVVVDEIHNYRNYKSPLSKALLKVTTVIHQRIAMQPNNPSPRLVTLSATPDYRALENYHQIMTYVKPALLGSYFNFRDRYCEVEEKAIRTKQRVATRNGSVHTGKSQIIPSIIGYKNTEELFGLLDPFTFKYDKTDFRFTYDLKEYDFTAAELVEYRKILKGTGLDVKYKLNLTVSDPVRAQLEPQMHNITMTVARTESVINERGVHVSPADLRISENVLYNGVPARVNSISELDADGTHHVRLIKAQAQLSQVENKFSLLDTLIRPDKGSLIYFNYKASVKSVYNHLLKNFPGRRIVIITGETTHIERVLESLGPMDLVLITRVACQSVDFYFDHLILYEIMTNPGQIEQLFGRLTRENSLHRDIHVDFLLRRVSVESYFYERLRLMLKTAQNNVYSGELPPSESMRGIPQAQINISFLKDKLLWTA